MRLSLGIIGSGKVGSTLAQLWFRAGYEIRAIYNRSPDKAYALAKSINSEVMEDPYQVLARSEIVFLTVPDNEIEHVVQKLSNASDLSGKAFVHTSGSIGVEAMHSLFNQGALVGSLHPIFPFADIQSSIENLPGAVFAIETDNHLLHDWLEELVAVLKGKTLSVPVGRKAYYHAALAISSNYTVTLYAIAQHMLGQLNANPENIMQALNVLLRATTNNIEILGIPDALTGPLSRGDTRTIRAHLEAIEDPVLRDVYCGLATLTYPILDQRGIDITQIEEALKGDHTK